MTRYLGLGDPNGAFPGVQGDELFDVQTFPNNYFKCDGGAVWIPTYVSGSPSGPWQGLASAPVIQPVVVPTPVSTPSSQAATVMNCRVGLSGQLYDPNTAKPGCIKWINLTPKQLKCLSKLTPAQYASRNITPSQDLQWNMFYEAKYLYIELSIAGTGGECSLSGIMASVNTKEINY